MPVHEAYNAPRQELPITYWQTGYLDIVKTKHIKSGSMMGNNIYPYILEDNCLDIDNVEDLC